MTRLNTTTVSMAVTPTVVSTLFSHYLKRGPLKQRPTAHLSYDEGLHLIRSFLDFASHHTVEELQAFTAQWVPHPQWVKVEATTISPEQLRHSAELIRAELGDEGIQQVGGRDWWQWRKPNAALEAEWIEMKSDANARKKANNPGRRVMLYVHGGAYFFGSVDEHRYQMQRHARKLKARVFAPRYRLSPQFPFPCGLQDCLAAYLYLLTVQDPSTIILAGDSAGGGMVMSLLCLIRNQGVPLPAGAILISPWVDLTHSFPSVSGDAPMDYIPQCGFHHKPSRSWPPPNDDDVAKLHEKLKMKHTMANGADKTEQTINGTEKSTGNEILTGGGKEDLEKYLSVEIDGKTVHIVDQIQMYATNQLLKHPLVSPVMQPTLGGLPPLLIMVGGGEILRDEQIFLAHKCANPSKYAPPLGTLTEKGKAQLEQFKPTDVQLQVWDDLCHVAPTLSFTRPAKYMYRSVAQFGAWALARAQRRGIEIMDDDQISVISSSESDVDENDSNGDKEQKKNAANLQPSQVGKAGDPLPRFRAHMIRQRVTRHGVTSPLAQESELDGCCMDVSQVGVIKAPTVKKWLEKKKLWDSRFATAKANVQKKILKDLQVGYQDFGPEETPPPTALAGRRIIGSELTEGKKKRSLGLSLWSLWGSKHDEDTLEREQKVDGTPAAQDVTAKEGKNARPYEEIQEQDAAPVSRDVASPSRSRRRTVVDENQIDGTVVDENTPVAELLRLRQEKEAAQSGVPSPHDVPATGVAGKRPFVQGVALPFSLGKDADTASMVTLNSAGSPMEANKQLANRSMVPSSDISPDPSRSGTPRPGIETFVTADDGIPQVTKDSPET